MCKRRLEKEPRVRRKWTQAENDLLIRLYPDHNNEYIAQMLHRSVSSVKNRAHAFGLCKPAEIAEANRQRNQFKKGQAAWNKGKAQKYWLSPESAKRCSKGWFPKGKARDDNPNSRKNKPLGHEKLYADGYVWIITEHGRKQKHRVVWEQANGPIPHGYMVKFRDGNQLNCALENLYLVSRADNAREIRAEMSPEKKKEIHRKAQAKRNASIRRDRLRVKWGLAPEGKLIKRT